MAPLPFALSREDSTELSPLIQKFSRPITSDLIQSIPAVRSVSSESSVRLSKRILQPFTSINKRQNIVAIPATYGDIDSGPASGTVIGIVLGSVAGFLLILWLLYSCMPGQQGPVIAQQTVTSEVLPEAPPSRKRSRRSRRSTRGVSETVEIRRGDRDVSIERVRVVPPPMPPPPMAPPPEMVRESIERREFSRGPPPRRVEREDDEVVVIEEHSPPRRKSKRSSREVRERERERESGYRNVDPLAYGGGGDPLRDIGRSRRSSRARS